MKKNNISLRILLFFFVLIVSFSFGFSFGNVGNQSTYFSHALNFVNPEFLKNDWLVHETTPYHGSFRWIVLLLAYMGNVGLGAAVLNTIFIAINIYIIYKIICLLNSRNRIEATFLTILFIVMDRTETVGSSYLFSDGLQPSTIATTLFLLAIYFFLDRRYLSSGISLAIGGLFHTNFLMLGIGLFALTHVFIEKKEFGSRILKQVFPSMILLAFSLPLILDAANGEGAKQARSIFLNIRSPHHYIPLSYSIEFFYLGGWVLCGLASLLALAEIERKKLVVALNLALIVSIGGATLLTTVVFVPQVSQLYVWRLAPFLLVISQLLSALFLVQFVQDPLPSSRYKIPSIILAVVGVLAIFRWVKFMLSPSVAALFFAFVALVYIALWLNTRKNLIAFGKYSNYVFSGSMILAILGLAGVRIPSVINESTLFGLHPDQLNEWARTTKADAVFLIPPELGNFRLLAQRAVVVDWKSTPIKPAELLAWYGKINSISGVTVHSINEAVKGYRSQSLFKLRDIAIQYNADYIVVNRSGVQQTDFFEKPLFDTDGYAVYPTITTQRSATSLPY